MTIYKTKSFVSDFYILLLGVFFALVNFANSLNFSNPTSTFSDAAPSMASSAKTQKVSSTTLPDIELPNNIYTPNRYLSIANKKIPIYHAYNGTKDDAGNRIAQYNNTFYYGHNSANVLGILPSLSIGTTFSVVEKDRVKTYKIAAGETFQKTGSSTLTLGANSDRDYSNTIYAASYRGKQYDIAIMTCAGEPLGGGDATARYVAFAYEI